MIAVSRPDITPGPGSKELIPVVTAAIVNPRQVVIVVDATAKFFADLESSGHQPLLAKVSGSLRFELSEGKDVERWRVDVRQGDVAVSHKSGAADCVLRAPKSLFDKLASGRENAMAAVLRGALVVAGNIDLFLAFQRILPSPPRHRSAARSTSGQQRKGGRSGR